MEEENCSEEILDKIASLPPPPSKTTDILSWLLQSGWAFILAGVYGAVSRLLTDTTIAYLMIVGLSFFVMSVYMRITIYKQKILFEMKKLEMIRSYRPPQPDEL